MLTPKVLASRKAVTPFMQPLDYEGHGVALIVKRRRRLAVGDVASLLKDLASQASVMPEAVGRTLAVRRTGREGAPLLKDLGA